MNIFQVVKENVTARQAAEQYGLKVNKNGMVCCPFHDDRHPSMKVDKGFCCFAPKTPEEEWKAEFIEACQQTEKINYDLDLLVFGELQDRIEFLLDSGKDVKRIEERMEEYRRNNKEQTGRSIGSEGTEL